MVLSRLHLAVDHSVDVDVLRGVDVDVYIMLVQVWLMLAEGRAGRIAIPVFDDGRIIGSGGRTVFFCLRDGLRLDIRKVDGIAVQTSDLIRVEVRVLAVVRRTVEIHFRNNGVLLAGVLHQNVRPAVDGVVLAELPLGRIVLIPLVMRMADLIQLDVLCCEVVQQVAASASHAGEKLRLGGLVIVGDRFDDDLLIVIDHADDVRPAVDRDRIKTCGRVFGVRLVLVPLAVVVPAVEVVFAGAVCSVVVGNVERSQINDCTLRLLFERNRLEFLGRVAVAVDHNVDGLQVELPLRCQRHGLGDRGSEIERFCCVLFEPAEELVAFLGGCSRLVRGCIALDRLCVDRRHAFHVDVERYVVVGVNVSPCIGDNPLFGRVVFRPLHIAPVVAFLTIGCRVKRLAALVVQADVDVYIVRIRLVGRVSRKRRFLQLLFQLRVVDQIAIQTLDASGNNHASGILGGLLAAIQEKRCGNGVLFTCQLADQFILLGHIELGDALVRVAKVLCGLIPAVEVVAGLFAAFEVIVRKIVLVVPVGDGEIVDLLAVLVIDRVPHGELIVRVQLHVAGLGDLRDNIAFRIAPVEELLRPFVVLEIRSLEGDRKVIRSKSLGVIDVFNVRGLDHTAPVVGDGVYRLALDVDRRLRPEPALLVIIVRFNLDRCRVDRVVRAVRAVVVLAIIRCKSGRFERDVRNSSIRLPLHFDAAGNRCQRHFDRVVAGIFRVADDIDKQLVKRVLRARDLLCRLARDVDLRDRCAETPRVICIGQRNFDVGRIDRSMRAVGLAIMFSNFFRLQDKLRGRSRSVPLHCHAVGGQILQLILNVWMRRLIIAHHRHVLLFHVVLRARDFLRRLARDVDIRNRCVELPLVICIGQRNFDVGRIDRSMRAVGLAIMFSNFFRLQDKLRGRSRSVPLHCHAVGGQILQLILNVWMRRLIIARHRHVLLFHGIRRVRNFRCGASNLNCRDCRNRTGD